MYTSTLVIIPTYNEKENITDIITDILERYPGIHLLVVDDNSPDGTAGLVKELQRQYDGLHLLEREGKQGIGSAYISGFRYAIKNDYQYIVQMDADFSHDPAAIEQFLEEIKEYDLVLGSRYKDGRISVVNWDWKRLLLSYFANVYARLVTGMPVSDATGGFKCFRRSALEAINLDAVRSNGYCFQVETTYFVWKKKLTIQQIPIVFTDRTKGTSKMSSGIIGEALYVLFSLRFRKNI